MWQNNKYIFFWINLSLRAGISLLESTSCFCSHYLVEEEVVSIDNCDSVMVGLTLIRMITDFFFPFFVFYSSCPIILLGYHSLPFQEGTNKIAISPSFSTVEMSLKAIWTCHPQERVDIDLPWTTTGN